MFSPYRSTASKYTLSHVETATQNELIENLEKQLDKRETKQNFHSPNPLSFPQRTSPNKRNYAKELLKQIEERYIKKVQEKSERKMPDICEDFHGYPNLPQTPREVRRAREKEKMRFIK